MLRVKCPDCSATIKCDQQSAGDQIACPECEHRLIVPLNATDLDALEQQARERQARQQAERRRQSAPVLAEALPAKLDDLLDLHRRQHRELCEHFGQLHTRLANLEQDAHTMRSNTTIIGVIVLLIGLPLLLTGGCAVLTAASM